MSVRSANGVPALVATSSRYTLVWSYSGCGLSFNREVHTRCGLLNGTSMRYALVWSYSGCGLSFNREIHTRCGLLNCTHWCGLINEMVGVICPLINRDTKYGLINGYFLEVHTGVVL